MHTSDRKSDGYAAVTVFPDKCLVRDATLREMKVIADQHQSHTEEHCE